MRSDDNDSDNETMHNIRSNKTSHAFTCRAAARAMPNPFYIYIFRYFRCYLAVRWRCVRFVPD